MVAMPSRPPPGWFWPTMLSVVALLCACESVTVGPAQVASVDIDPETATLVVNQSETLSVVARASTGNVLNGRVVTWSSLDPEIASVDSDGVVRGLSTGMATIQATVDGVTGTATILVASSPGIALSESAIEFSASSGDDPTAPKTVAIGSGGDTQLAGLEAAVGYRSPGPTGWLQVSLSRAETPAVLSVRGDPGALAAGVHLATVTVTSADPQVPPGTLEVEFRVGQASPQIVVSSSSVSLAADQGRDPPTARLIDVSNGGEGTLSGLSFRVAYAGSGSGWLVASLSGSTAPAVLSVGVNTNGLSPGVYDAVIELTASSAPGAETDVQVRFRYGDPPPEIELGADEVTWSFPEGTLNLESERVAVTNRGAGTLRSLSAEVTYAAGGPQGWLLAAIGSTAPAELVLSVDDPGFVPGIYRASVKVLSPDAINSPQSLDVVVSVSATPSVERSMVTAAPADIPANGVAISLITVRLLDSRGDPIPSGAHVVTVAATAGTIGPVGDAGDGVYTAALTSGTTAASARVTARVDGRLIADTATVTFTALPPTPTTVTGTLTASPSSIVADGVSTAAITLQLRDAQGNPTSGSSPVVAFATTLGSLSPISSQGGGLYSATLTSSATAGTATVTATLNGVVQTSTASVSFTAVAPPPPPPTVTGTLTASPSSIVADGVSTAAVTLQLRDAQGNPTSGSNPVVALATTLGTLGPITNPGGGQYTATLTSSATAGTAVVSATLGGVLQTSTATVTFTAAVSANGTCLSVITGGTYEQIVVPPGASCTLVGVQVATNVDVKRGASLFALAGARIGGDLKADQPAIVDLQNTSVVRNVHVDKHLGRVVLNSISVGGSIEIKDGADTTVSNTSTGDRLLLEKNEGELTIEANGVGGDLLAIENRGVPAAMRIANNRVTGKLECKRNTPAPVGGLNTAGTKIDQCVTL